MSKDSKSALDRGVDVESILEQGFGEVDFEEIKVGFEEVEASDSGEDLEEDLTDDDLRQFLALGFVEDIFGIDGIGSLDLEGVLFDDVMGDGSNPEEGGLGDGDFYDSGVDIGELYDNDSYIVPRVSNSEGGGPRIEYEDFIDMNDVNISSKPHEVRPGERSMLEISGFRDEAAEKRRQEKRDRFW